MFGYWPIIPECEITVLPSKFAHISEISMGPYEKYLIYD